jgi:hypothetical protein
MMSLPPRQWDDSVTVQLYGDVPVLLTVVITKGSMTLESTMAWHHTNDHSCNPKGYIKRHSVSF